MRFAVRDRRRHLVSDCEPLLHRWCFVSNLHQHAFKQSTIKMLTTANAYIRAAMEISLECGRLESLLNIFRMWIIPAAEVERFRKAKNRQRCLHLAINSIEFLQFGRCLTCWNRWSNLKRFFVIRRLFMIEVQFVAIAKQFLVLRFFFWNSLDAINFEKILEIICILNFKFQISN